MPLSPESWTHRNGRTARMGAEGMAYLLTSEGDTVPDFVEWQREYAPKGAHPDGIRSDVATIYINAGKKEKISRKDIAGYLIQRGGLEMGEIGKIIIWDHSAIVAVPRAKVDRVISLLLPHKLKGVRVRPSRLL